MCRFTARINGFTSEVVLDFGESIGYDAATMSEATGHIQHRDWYYYYFTPPAPLVGRSVLNR